ncbi:Hypothetical protein PBC10988_12170 [Planctomycetales bacterium 10988]|nr:Hypothetical protein PBC10988_12170 [Planctomycetales bacterium 10988]
MNNPAPSIPHLSARWKCFTPHFLLLAGSFVLMGCTGCEPAQNTTPPPTQEVLQAEGLFTRSLDILNDVERYNEGFEKTVDVQGEIVRLPVENFRNPEMLDTVVFQSNQWLRSQPVEEGWQPDPILLTLPSELREDLLVSQTINDLEKLRFAQDNKAWTFHDGWHLQEAIWLKEIAEHAKGEQADPLARARLLFDWTIRNIQLVESPENQRILPFQPWQVLLLGKGEVYHRAQIFTLLARQLGLDITYLTFPDPQNPSLQRSWVVGLLHDQELYLFDPQLGTPIPGPEGQGIATLSQVQKDDQLLRQLDLPERPYPVEAEMLAGGVTALVEASPHALARRMQILQAYSSGENRLVLTVDASELASRLERIEAVKEAIIWPLPYENIRTLSLFPAAIDRLKDALYPFIYPFATLWNARVAHLKGKYISEVGDHRADANQLYLKVRLNARDPRWINALGKLGVQMGFNEENNPFRFTLEEARQNASYWLGLVAYETKSYSASVNHLNTRTLADYPQGIWVRGAHYNLGRAYEQLNQPDRAKQAYEKLSDPISYAERAWRIKQLNPTEKSE